MDIRNTDNFKGTIPSITPEGVTNSREVTKQEESIKAQKVNNTDNIPSPLYEGDIDDELIQAYLSLVQTKGFTLDDINSLLVTILDSGNCFYEFTLLEKIPVTFSIRPAWVSSLILQELEKEKPEYGATYSDIINRYNLASSLVKYNGKVIFNGTKDGLKLALDFIDSLPFIIQVKLIDQLAIFDRLVTVATSDWALKNFIKPQ